MIVVIRRVGSGQDGRERRMMFAGDGGPPTFSEQVFAMMDPRREKLLKAKLGDLLNWRKPEIVETVGPYDPTAFDDHDADVRLIVTECVAALEKMTDEKIDLLLEKPDEFNAARFEWSAVMNERIRILNRRPQLPWYAGGFGHPEHAADFEHWSKMASFRVHEILCLSVGVEPGHIHEEIIAKISTLPSGELDKKWPAIQFLVRRRVQLVRRFPPAPGDRRISPLAFLKWADQVHLDVHPELLRLLRRYHVEEASEPAASAAPPRQDAREVDTIAQLFTAMAIKRYRYDPRQTRSEVPRKIVDMAASMGITISDDTVRKYLKKGAQLIPEDWKPE